MTAQTTLLALQLYLAHVVADFLLRPDRVLRDARRPSGLAAHAAIHIAAACVTVNVGLDLRIFLGLVLLAVVHVALDYTRLRLVGDGPVAFAVSQTAHLLTVGIAAVWLTTSWAGATQAILGAAHSKRLYLY